MSLDVPGNRTLPFGKGWTELLQRFAENFPRGVLEIHSDHRTETEKRIIRMRRVECRRGGLFFVAGTRRG